MQDRKPLVMGNWKMHLTHGSATQLAQSLASDLEEVMGVDAVVFPPFPYLAAVTHALGETLIAVGGQDVSRAQEGAYTGEVSARMLQDLGCEYTLVGHSECRQYHNDTNDVLRQKFLQALEVGLQPVLCVGETLEQRDQGQAFSVIQEQVASVLKDIAPERLSHVVIAYEPVWAIGTGRTATPEQAQEVHAFIRQTVAEQCEKVAKNMRIVYGGSVKSGNAKALFSMPDIDGGLVGGASLKAEEFTQICLAAE